MGYIREPKNVDLVVGPSVFDETTRQTITRAIALYKKTGQKPVSVKVVTEGPANATTYTGRTITASVQLKRASKNKVKI